LSDEPDVNLDTPDVDAVNPPSEKGGSYRGYEDRADSEGVDDVDPSGTTISLGEDDFPDETIEFAQLVEEDGSGLDGDPLLEEDGSEPEEPEEPELGDPVVETVTVDDPRSPRSRSSRRSSTRSRCSSSPHTSSRSRCSRSLHMSNRNPPRRIPEGASTSPSPSETGHADRRASPARR
jgi:hypothetical protein